MFRVLIADNDSDQRLLTVHALRRHGSYEVIAEVEDGTAAVEAAAKHQPDLVLLDIAMPGLNGLEALPRIIEEAPGTRVIVVSGFPQAEAERAAVAGGAVAYLEKGSSPVRLGDDLLSLASLLDVVEEAAAGVRGRFKAEPLSAARARRFVSAALRRWQCAQLLEDVQLMVSELVTNAIVHGKSEAEVVVRLVDGGVRVEVFDRSTDAPALRRADEDETTGRGLELVQALSSAWGVTARSDGKSVWFEVPAPAESVTTRR